MPGVWHLFFNGQFLKLLFPFILRVFLLCDISEHLLFLSMEKNAKIITHLDGKQTFLDDVKCENSYFYFAFKYLFSCWMVKSFLATLWVNSNLRISPAFRTTLYKYCQHDLFHFYCHSSETPEFYMHSLVVLITINSDSNVKNSSIKLWNDCYHMLVGHKTRQKFSACDCFKKNVWKSKTSSWRVKICIWLVVKHFKYLANRKWMFTLIK